MYCKFWLEVYSCGKYSLGNIDKLIIVTLAMNKIVRADNRKLVIITSFFVLT